RRSLGSRSRAAQHSGSCLRRTGHRRGRRGERDGPGNARGISGGSGSGRGARVLRGEHAALGSEARMVSAATNLKIRVIPCLDVRDGRVVKGTRFVDLVDAGDPVEAAARYDTEGADEIVYLDISATPEGRGAGREVVERTARSLFVPLTVGGGVRSCADAERLLRAGADRIAVNSAAVERQELLDDLWRAFGSPCIVLAVDAVGAGPRWAVRTEGGRRRG